jgi:hypothetical protein
VRVTSAAPHFLRGDLLDVSPATRRPRLRIPVAAAP